MSVLDFIVTLVIVFFIPVAIVVELHMMIKELVKELRLLREEIHKKKWDIRD